jgi:triosephosphate isomerase
MKRRPFIAGNWKMFKTIGETKDFCTKLLGDGELLRILASRRVEAAIAPPFTALSAAAEVLHGSAVHLCGQDVFWAESGAYTGEVSPVMLADVGCRYCIVGHSERRQFFHETDETVHRKLAALIKIGLTPILCVGETLAERQKGSTFGVVEGQVRKGLSGLSLEQADQLTIAYEPVWAIGTGQTATPQQAQEVQAFIRRRLGEIFSPSIAEGMRILYGGSVKPDNIADLMAMEDVDGALVGGASLDPQSFSRIIRGCEKG